MRTLLITNWLAAAIVGAGLAPVLERTSRGAEPANSEGLFLVQELSKSYEKTEAGRSNGVAEPASSVPEERLGGPRAKTEAPRERRAGVEKGHFAGLPKWSIWAAGLTLASLAAAAGIWLWRRRTAPAKHVRSVALLAIGPRPERAVAKDGPPADDVRWPPLRRAA